jgi:dihydroorotate dehydrogenase (NAD+) catalytic subunit
VADASPLAQELFGTFFRSPVLLASGTCGYGQEYEGLIPLDELGGLVTKAVSVEPRAGNPPHRVAETPGGMINAIGLDNVGLERFREEKLPWLRDHLERARVLVNVVGHTVDDFAAVVAGLDGEEGFLGYEVNVSCPNVEGGTLFGTDRDALARLVGRLREETERPLLVKLTPNVPDIGVHARICEEAGADGLSTINTFPGMLVDVDRRRPVIGNVTGGVSGPAILPMGVYLTWRAARAVDIPVVGIGGIRSAEDALQYVLAGASLVQVGTALFVDPAAARGVHEGLEAHVEAQGVDRLTELVGALETGPTGPPAPGAGPDAGPEDVDGEAVPEAGARG